MYVLRVTGYFIFQEFDGMLALFSQDNKNTEIFQRFIIQLEKVNIPIKHIFLENIVISRVRNVLKETLALFP